MRCEAFVGKRYYDAPGRCLKTRNVQSVHVREGAEGMRVWFCTTHRKLVAARRPPAVAR